MSISRLLKNLLQLPCSLIERYCKFSYCTFSYWTLRMLWTFCIITLAITSTTYIKISLKGTNSKYSNRLLRPNASKNRYLSEMFTFPESLHLLVDLEKLSLDIFWALLQGTLTIHKILPLRAFLNNWHQ